ncbi:HAD-IIIC family phosphatase [Candidatus Bathyarchaeota archaeon]|nr:HAD-IIIC family phosphatase [Candidatus Bathyarchaeota archaeon]
MVPMANVKIIVFDVDDTLWYSVADDRALERFKRLDERRVSDHVGHAQELVENASTVLHSLVDLGYILCLGTMGPESQVRSFMEAFELDHIFNFQLSLFDRVDKAEKIRHTLSMANEILDEPVHPKDVVFVDDNMGYLKDVNDAFPDVKCVWAHYRMPPGLRALNADMVEMHGVKLW